MNLSPRNLLGARAMLLPAWPLEDDDEREVKTVTAYQCPRCGDLHEWKSDAEECCAELKKKAVGRVFPVCGYEHDSYFAAVDCCLWIDLDFATRLKVASALDNGSDWKTELALA